MSLQIVHMLIISLHSTIIFMIIDYFQILVSSLVVGRINLLVWNIYLWSKVVCLYRWDSPNWDASDRVLGLFGKLSTRRGAWAWFHDVWSCGAKVREYWMISSLKIKLNHSWKFRRSWNVPLMLLERSWQAGFNGEFIW
jgi:hypothetical protein